MRGAHVEKRKWKDPRTKRQRVSRWWFLSFYVGGRHRFVRSDPPTESKRAAEEQLREALVHRSPTGRTTAAAIIGSYRTHLKAQAPTTARAAEAALRRLERVVGGLVASSVGASHVADLVRQLRAKGYSDGYIAGHLTLLKAAFRAASPKEVPPDHPLRTFRIPFQAARRRAIWQDEELAAVCRLLAPWASSLARLLRFTGLRIGDALALRWENVRPGVLQLRVQKSGKETAIPLSPRAEDVLQQLPRCSPWVFPSETLKTPKTKRNFARLWYPALEEAGVTGRTVHDLRRTFAQELHRVGVPDRMIAALLGQETTSMVARYSWAELDVLREALGRAARAAVHVLAPSRQSPAPNGKSEGYDPAVAGGERTIRAAELTGAQGDRLERVMGLEPTTSSLGREPG